MCKSLCVCVVCAEMVKVGTSVRDCVPAFPPHGILGRPRRGVLFAASAVARESAGPGGGAIVVGEGGAALVNVTAPPATVVAGAGV